MSRRLRRQTAEPVSSVILTALCRLESVVLQSTFLSRLASEKMSKMFGKSEALPGARLNSCCKTFTFSMKYTPITVKCLRFTPITVRFQSCKQGASEQYAPKTAKSLRFTPITVRFLLFSEWDNSHFLTKVPRKSRFEKRVPESAFALQIFKESPFPQVNFRLSVFCVVEFRKST